MRDKNIWLFNAGNAFAGNPKWLFMYIQEHHPEITCYWLCYRRSLVEKLTALGYNAMRYKSSEARRIGERAGVYVVEQNKEVYQDYLRGITVVNLWHGVTCKKLEHAVTQGYMEEGLVAKHIRNEAVYRQQLMLVTSPEQERVFCEQCKIDADHVIRAPYPNCFYRGEVRTFDHDFRAAKGLARQTKVALYAPTFRDFDKSSFFSKAIPDMDALARALEKDDWLLIIKAHPQMENDFQLAALKRTYGDHPRFLFWDNGNDVYEVADQIDLAIVDYSSIFFDLLARGVKRFARYPFDLDDKEHLRDFAFDYLEVTCGTVCMDFEALLAEFSKDEPTDPAEVKRVFDWAWGYAHDHSIEEIVERARAYSPDPDVKLPTLYSYDVFDTLLCRSTGDPASVFAIVQKLIAASGEAYPAYLRRHYVAARMQAEANCRQYVDRTLELRGDGRTEITFDMIFRRLQDVFELTDGQAEQLKRWEFAVERAASEPVRENVDEAARLARSGETVILVSDMYLPEAFVTELLAAADPVLAGLPLFLSSTTGRQKTKKGLFLDAFHALDYRFGEWVHIGDSQLADVQRPRELGITAKPYTPPGRPPAQSKRAKRLRAVKQAIFAPHAKGAGAVSGNAGILGVAAALGTADAYRAGDLMCRLMAGRATVEERFATSHAALYFVPYVYWAIDHALRHGVGCLYFIARDGYHLKRIADAIIARRGLPIKTKYLYGSRKAWRVASQIDRIDDDFFSSYGNFTGVVDYPSLLAASHATDAEFQALFPDLAFLADQGKIAKDERDRIVERLRDSAAFRAHVLEKAAEERPIVLDYLRQEIDFSQKFAFVEYWGRGYTQACHTRLLQAADPRARACTYYYARSICPTQGDDVRVNFTTNTRSLIFIEAIFANMPHASVAGYRREGETIVPVMDARDCRRPVFDALDEWLPRFADAFAGIPFDDPDCTMRELFDFAVEYFHTHQADEAFLKCIAPLRDSMSIQGEPVEYAPKLTVRKLVGRIAGKPIGTSSRRMTVARTHPILARLVERYSDHSSPVPRQDA